MRKRDAGERETHVAVLWRQLLQEDPKPRLVGGPVGVQARKPQAQNFRVLRRCGRRGVVGFAFLFPPLLTATPSPIWNNFQAPPPSRSRQGQVVHSCICALMEAGWGGPAPPSNGILSYALSHPFYSLGPKPRVCPNSTDPLEEVMCIHVKNVKVADPYIPMQGGCRDRDYSCKEKRATGGWAERLTSFQVVERGGGQSVGWRACWGQREGQGSYYLLRSFLRILLGQVAWVSV